ncbi:hypothetical protein [Streptococcus suis]|uniref:hypothetical protein n=1 Tax=Streptococcus suis TaxID=1307 RepID=UPI0039089B23
MVNNVFSYQNRVNQIEEMLSGYNQLKQLAGNPLIQISQNLTKTLESSLVVAIYSLSEQLLKYSLYSILEIEFEEERKTAKDKFILKQMPIENFPISPTLDRIKKEIKVYSSEFKLFLPASCENYKNAYIELLNARHEFAHANNHTDDIDFLSALKFIEYLKLQYEEFEGRGYINKISLLSEQLAKFRKIDNYQGFERLYLSKKSNLDTLILEIDTMFNTDTKYDIDYLNDILEVLNDIYKEFQFINEDNFASDFSPLLEKL